jgi:hypothetical protein
MKVTTSKKAPMISDKAVVYLLKGISVSSLAVALLSGVGLVARAIVIAHVETLSEDSVPSPSDSLKECKHESNNQ